MATAESGAFVSARARASRGSRHAATPSNRATPTRAVRRAAGVRVLSSVPPRHPVGQDVVDRRRLNESLQSTVELEWTPLPEKIGVDALVDAHGHAGSIVLAFGVLAAQVDIVIAPWPLQPEVEQYIGLGVTRCV